MFNTSSDDRLISQSQIGHLAGVARATVTYWRGLDGFPPAEPAGDMELYRQDEVLSWLDERQIPGRSRGPSEPAGATYGDRARRTLRNTSEADGGTPPPGTPPLRPASSERNLRDLPRVRELMGEPIDRVRGAGSVVDYMNLLLCLLFLRYLVPRHWAGLVEQSQRGSGSDGSRLLLRRVGQMTDEALRRRGMVPGMEEQLLRLEPRSYDDLLQVVRMTEELGPDAFRLVLDEYERQAALRSGEFFTPRAVAGLLVAIALEERPGPLGPVFDPYARGGELLVAAAEHLDRSSPVTVRGYSHAHGTARLASMNLALQGVPSSVRLSRRAPWAERREGDAPRYSLVLTNPPFNMNESTRKARAEGQWPYGAPPVGNDNLAHVQYAVGCLDEGGVAAVIMPNKAGDSANPAERAIRERLVERGVVLGVVELPDRLFSNTSVPVSVWLLGPPTAAAGDVVFVDAREAGATDKGRRVLRDEDVRGVVAAYRAVRPVRNGEVPFGSRGGGSEPFAAVAVPRGSIRDVEYSLRPAVHLSTGPRPPRAGADAEDELLRVWRIVAQRQQRVRQADAEAQDIGPAVALRPPADGPAVTLADICEIAAGPSFARLRDAPPGPHGDVPMVYPSHLRNGRIDHDDDRFVPYPLAERLAKFQVLAGDILCIRTGAMGPPALVRPEETGWLISTNLLRLRVKEAAPVDPAYLVAYLGRPDSVAWVRDRASATGAPTISRASLGTQPVFLPALDEQRRIAWLLGALEAQITAHLEFAAAVAEARAETTELLTTFSRPVPIAVRAPGEAIPPASAPF
jgi:type I restriction enzyme M protein